MGMGGILLHNAPANMMVREGMRYDAWRTMGRLNRCVVEYMYSTRGGDSTAVPLMLIFNPAMPVVSVRSEDPVHPG
jgi:hypothetical protein